MRASLLVGASLAFAMTLAASASSHDLVEQRQPRRLSVDPPRRVWPPFGQSREEAWARVERVEDGP